MTVVVTGANGFVGRALCTALRAAGQRVRGIVRTAPAGDPALECDEIFTGDLSGEPDWGTALQGAASIVHLAGRAHVTREQASDPGDAYRRINVEGTRRLACAAVDAGVRRLVFVSSIKVNGEASQIPFTESDAPRPEDAYGRTKWEAEQVLQQIAAASRLEIVILRPPLVYGPRVQGNFLTLMHAAARGLPLPLASIANRRSLIYLGNLVDAIAAGLVHPAAAGKTYLLADDAGVSTPDLVRAIAHALGKRARLLPCPPAWLKLAGMAVGKSDAVSRLTGSLQINSGRIRRELEWLPRYDMVHGLEQTARWYDRQRHDNNN